MQKLRTKKWYIIHPIWDKEKTKSGLSTASEMYEQGENPPAWYYPTSGIVIDAPKDSPVKAGDTIYFTWTAFYFENCISPRDKHNIWGIQHNIIGYKREDTIYSMDYMLLEKIVVEQEQLAGSALAPEIIKHSKIRYLHGIVKYLPEQTPLKKLFNPYTGESEDLVPGKKVVIDDMCDVPVSLNGDDLYRTRFTEVMYCYD